MFDHVGVHFSDHPASERFYRAVLGALGLAPSHADPEVVGWDDWWIGPTDAEHPATRGLHVAFRAEDAAQAEACLRAGVAAGGTRAGDVVGAPDGTTVEAVHAPRADAVAPGRIDRLALRVADVAAAARFYATIAGPAQLTLVDEGPERARFAGPGFDLDLLAAGPEAPPSAHVHLAFTAEDRATVHRFHEVATAAGHPDHGAPGERDYHPGYYAAFVLDPDGHNVEVVHHGEA